MRAMINTLEKVEKHLNNQGNNMKMSIPNNGLSAQLITLKLSG